MKTLPLTLLSLCALCAQTPAPAPTTAPAPDPAPKTWSAGPIDFSGLIDGYYSFNFNHPDSGFTTLRNFEVKANQFSLNMTKLTMSHTADPVGFTLDVGFGRAWKIFHATDPAGTDIVQYIPQAYVSLKPPSWGGFQFDFGKFYTSAGAELPILWTVGLLVQAGLGDGAYALKASPPFPFLDRGRAVPAE